MSTRDNLSTVDDPTIGRLVADATRDISALVQSEIKLAKSEIRVSATAGGVGAALILIAAFFGLLIIILLSIAIAYFITMTGLDPAYAFLIVSGAYLLLAALLIFIGIRKLKKIRAPVKTIATAREIPAALKGHPGKGHPVEVNTGTVDSGTLSSGKVKGKRRKS
ncbi:phage holin family protein [Aeromicrobium sp.]|uniref:phage holin family protein n=1 Tax=Aeromicrobium sp. TaxID=1871063 RepID=UPI0019AAF770|nr:phage holin family protein [Aeromicrobium sp.]MBC7633691.1 phage holin family protein [Aeromicrobium sp.]